MKNKWFVSLLMVVVMTCACWTGAGADEKRKTFTSGDYEYALLDDGTVEITKYKGKAERLAIPDTLDGKRVTAIGEQAFSFCSSLTIISIPDSVAQIGENPFAACSSLKSISVSPEHPYFATIDGVLFRKADKTLISYPAGISSSTYTIPQGITSIGDSAFSSCDSLTSVSIPDSVTSIGDSAFSYCYFLTSVSIPDSVEQIGTNPFAACFELKSISASPDHPYFATIDGVLFRKADKALISYPASISSSTYTIPRGITAIGDSAFSSCDSLTSVSIPDSVTSIGDGAFSFCTSLTSVSIPDSVTAIGDEAFYSCSSLTSVSIPDSVTSIGDSAFFWCSSLTSVSIPDSVTAIGDSAFSYCDSLTSVSIPDSVTAIGDEAFYSCSSLTSVNIPNSVTSIGDYAFGDCSNLTLTVPRNSYALEYAKTNNIPYTYPDANDWLNN
ncbi:MAG TPA: leucine-rich repeat domain-containing protein [Clostridiales bacterium]|nr:leucine-rich repeat domain-containing protein [Clostridiales bacterium]